MADDDVRPNGTLAWRMAELERRYNAAAPELANERVKGLEEDIRTVKRLLWGLIVAVLGGSISLTVALLQSLGSGTA